MVIHFRSINDEGGANLKLIDIVAAGLYVYIRRNVKKKLNTLKAHILVKYTLYKLFH